jgi:hypothetical protein
MSKATSNETALGKVKNLLADPAQRIGLDDFVTAELKNTLKSLNIEHFPVSTQATDQDFQERLKAYEGATRELLTTSILIARWGGLIHSGTFKKIFARLVEADKGSGGTVVWLRLGWYPVQLVMYGAGISALAAQNYQFLATMFLMPVHERDSSGGPPDLPLVVRITNEISELTDTFKRLPGHETQFTPRSEHLFTQVHDPLEKALFLGNSYEFFFDQFEILWALTYADLTRESRGRVWGPPGRFAWKHRRGHGSPYEHLIKEAQDRGAAWAPLKSGLFMGDPKRFAEVAKAYAELMAKFNWW